MNKKSLRDGMGARREHLSPSEIHQYGQAMLRSITALPDYPKIRRLGCYVSAGGEVDTHALINRAIADGKQVAVPVVRAKGQMDFQYIASLDDLKPGRFGLLSPPSEAAKIAPSEALEWIVAPGLAFDRCGHRLGRGRGYYDRYLARTRATRIGLAYAFQVVDTIPVEPHDMPMHLIVTECEVIQCRVEKQSGGKRRPGIPEW